jgi:hypothetical protein
MSYIIDRLDPQERVREKQASRDRDAWEIASGQASPSDVARRNDFFRPLDLNEFRIVAIGRRPVSAGM